MEYVGGGDLRELISKYKLNPEIIQLLIAEIVIALNYIHNKNIYHRDLKPENILITNEV